MFRAKRAGKRRKKKIGLFCLARASDNGDKRADWATSNRRERALRVAAVTAEPHSGLGE
jgi:hypothetical protein